jgi:EAL domain-containing protein (putative c-di-GMP-specific phosphodiesterase class I)
VQGYLYSRPMPVDSIPDFIATWESGKIKKIMAA